MNGFDYENERAWYVVQTASGMEHAAKRYLESRIKTMGMEDYIFKILIPERIRQEKKKNGQIKEISEKIYPGYLFVDMIVTDESWFVVRNTPMVTGFLGSSGGGAKPVPLTNDEVIPILKQCGITLEMEAAFKVGDTVTIISGTFVGQDATIEEIDVENQTIVVLVDFIGQQTPYTLRFDEVVVKKDK